MSNEPKTFGFQKNFMAVVVLKLVEQGKIELDRAIATYLPRDNIACIFTQ
ncbi:serine hydrolase [Nostoc sp. CHAB 5834]|nr:serine hydrolase [Nostoc sp. CHAB 5834]